MSLLLYPPLLLEEGVVSDGVLAVSGTGELEGKRKGDAWLRDGGGEGEAGIGTAALCRIRVGEGEDESLEEKKPGVRGDGDEILMGDEAGGAFRRTRLAGILMRLRDGGEFEEMLIGDEFGVLLGRARFVAGSP